MTRHHQISRLPAKWQGEVCYETTAKRPDLVCIDSVSYSVDIHFPDTEIALRNSVPGRKQGGGGFHGLRIR